MQFGCKDNHFFVKTRLIAGMRRFLAALMALFIYTAASAGPARPGKILLTQPDGSKFYAIFAGDEFMKIKMTEAGEAIIQDEQGWWCYAVYDFQGIKTSTGCRVGTAAQIPDGTRNIPYDLLSRRAAGKRRMAELSRTFRLESRVRLQSQDTEKKNKTGLVILVQFSGTDEKFKFSKENFVNMLTQEGYSANGATGSAKEYFDQQFNGKYEFSFDVTDVVTVSQKRSYYGKNDSEDNDENPHIMVIEACRLADEQGVDFSKYDQDGDGEVDNVFVFFAGLDEASGASKDHIWSHAWYIKDGAGEELKLDGVLINRYACSSEREGDNYQDVIMAGIGTFCHEYSHTLGLPDFYDADYSEGGFSAALWLSTSLMDGGNYNNDGNTPPYFNAMEREILGLSQPVVIDSPGTYELPPINQGKYYRINTSTEDEYFLIEYRDNSNWDRYIGGSGILVYHVDKSRNSSGYSYLYDKTVTAYERWDSQVDINTLAEHQCADLIEADGRTDKFSNYTDKSYINLQKSLQGIFFPGSKGNSLTPVSLPGLGCWENSSVALAVTDINISDGKASFNVVTFSLDNMPTPVNVQKDVFQDGAIISFESSFEFSGEAKVEYGPSGGSMRSVLVNSYQPGKWAIELKGLNSTTSYSLQISFVSQGVAGLSAKSPFMTKKRSTSELPYIHMDSEGRNEDGTLKKGAKLPLKVYNTKGVEEIIWKFNGQTITSGPDLYYRLESSGTMEAHLLRNDGSEDVIIREIRVYDN